MITRPSKPLTPCVQPVVAGANRIATPFAIAFVPALLLALGVLAIVRGSAGVINPHVFSYYVINYQSGLIRRGLVGEAWSWFLPQGDLNAIRSVLLAYYWPLVAVLLLSLVCWVIAIERRRRDFLFSALFAVFLTSQFMPTLAYDVGFLDVFVFLLIVAVAAALARRQYVIVAMAGLVGPFVHEAFLFYWLPVVAVGLWEQRSLRRGIVLALPLASVVCIYLFASREIAIAQMSASPLPDPDKQEAIAQQFGQTLLTNLAMIAIKYRNYPANVIAAFAFFAFPALAIIGLYGMARRQVTTTIVLVLSAIGPLLILLIAWDLSRFIVASVFTVLIAALNMETVRPAPPARWQLPAVGALLALVLVQVPFTYAYFEVAAVTDVGPEVLRNGPVGRLTRGAVALYSRAIGPVTSERRGQDALPTGNAWFVEEDIWRGTWIRRPGTNEFDAAMTLPNGSIATYRVTVERDGDTIIAHRNAGADDRLDYVGRLDGRSISGTYVGGYWFARIEAR